MCWYKLVINWLILIGISIVTFSLKVGVANSFPNLAGLEDREVKNFLSICFSIFIILYGFYKNGFKKIDNIYLLFLIGFLMLHRFIAPVTELQLFDRNVGGFWNYEPLFDVWLSLLLVLSIASFSFKKFNINRILKVLMWVGMIQAGYMIAQRFGLDPWQVIKQDHNSLFATNGQVTGTLTHPAFSSLFIAVILPITFYFKKYLAFVFIILGLISANSQVAYGVSFSCLWVYIFWNMNLVKKIILFFSTIVCSLFLLYFFGNLICDSGRFPVWLMIWKDILHPTFFKYSAILTGYGLGSYSYIFPFQHSTEFDHAHNDYLEFFYNVGIFGILFLVLSIKSIFNKIISKLQNKELKLLTVTLFGLFISAFFIFTFQMQPFKFLVLIIIGILYSYDNEQRENNLEC